jgi:hypothetical protein
VKIRATNPNAGPRARTRALGVVIAVGAAVLGCGGGKAASDAGGAGGSGGAGAGGDGGMLPPADHAFIAAFCAAFAPCCATNGRTADAATCKQWLVKLGMSGDAQVRSACLDELNQLATARACMPDMANLADPCVRLFYEPSGSRAPGETCTSTADCAGSAGTVTYCHSTCIRGAAGAAGAGPCLATQSTSGVIVYLVVGSEGILCRERDGLYCDPADGLCKPLLPVGSACASGICASGSCGTSGCLPLPGFGEACTSDCAGDNYCDTTTMCAPKLAAGTTCTFSAQCTGTCQGSDLCSGTCDNGACSPLTDIQELLVGRWCGTVPVSP